MNAEMAPLRAEIDAIDRDIVALLARRFALTGRIGEIKARVAEPPRDPGRQAERARLLQTLAAENGLDHAVVQAVYRVISSEVVERHARAAGRPL